MKGSYRAIFVWKDNPNTVLSITFNSNDFNTAITNSTVELSNIVGGTNTKNWHLSGVVNSDVLANIVEKAA